MRQNGSLMAASAGHVYARRKTNSNDVYDWLRIESTESTGLLILDSLYLMCHLILRTLGCLASGRSFLKTATFQSLCVL